MTPAPDTSRAALDKGAVNELLAIIKARALAHIRTLHIPHIDIDAEAMREAAAKALGATGSRDYVETLAEQVPKLIAGAVAAATLTERSEAPATPVLDSATEQEEKAAAAAEAEIEAALAHLEPLAKRKGMSVDFDVGTRQFLAVLNGDVVRTTNGNARMVEYLESLPDAAPPAKT